MKILLTGALGFIGKNFLIHRKKDWQIFALDFNEDKIFQKKIKNAHFFKINLTDENKVKLLAKKMPHFDVCLHLAANGDPAISISDPGWDLKSTTLTLINVCQNFRIKKLIYLSSGAIYGGHVGLINPTLATSPTLPYAISHLAAEHYARFFGQDGEYVVIRFFGAYGPYEPERKIYGNLIKTFAINNKKDFTIRSDGQNLIDAMYISDAIKGFEKVILSKKTNLTVDFCKGDHPTINGLVEEAARVFKTDIKIKHEGEVPEYNKFYASPDKFAEIFHFKPEISLEKGMLKMYEHLKS